MRLAIFPPRLPWAITLLLAAACTPAGAQPADAAAPTRSIVFTIDDLPGRLRTPTLRNFQEVNRRMLAALKAARVPAIGFVNEKPLHVPGERDARIGLLRAWLDAGMTLGNHTFRHRSLSRTPLAEYQDDVLRGEVLTRQVLEERKQPLTWFRHPYTHSGPTLEIKAAFERFLADRGYKVAPFTFDHSDWVYSTVYEHARADRDRALEKRVRQQHLAHFEAALVTAEAQAQALFGRDIPQIVLTHVNRINADLYPEMLAMLRRRGYAFVTLEQALSDPAYATPESYASKEGATWLTRWSRHLGRPLPGGGPRVPEDLEQMYRTITAKLGSPGDL